MPAVWPGTVTLPTTSGNMTPTDVLYVVPLFVNMISLSALAKTNHATKISLLSGDVIFSLNDGTILTVTMKDDVFIVDLRADTYLAEETSVQTLTAQQWHVITSYTPYSALARMACNGTIPGCILILSGFLQAGTDTACKLCFSQSNTDRAILPM